MKSISHWINGLVYPAKSDRSGEIFNPATGKIVEGGVAEQTRQTLINLQKILDVKGAKFSDVVKVTAHLQDVNRDFAAYDAVYREFFTAPFPVRTTVGSDLINILVEIDFVVGL